MSARSECSTVCMAFLEGGENPSLQSHKGAPVATGTLPQVTPLFQITPHTLNPCPEYHLKKVSCSSEETELQVVSGNFLAIGTVVQLQLCARGCSIQTLDPASCLFWQAQHLPLSPGHQKAVQLRIPASQVPVLPASLNKGFLLVYSSSLFRGGLLSLWWQQSQVQMPLLGFDVSRLWCFQAKNLYVPEMCSATLVSLSIKKQCVCEEGG